MVKLSLNTTPNRPIKAPDAAIEILWFKRSGGSASAGNVDPKILKETEILQCQPGKRRFIIRCAMEKKAQPVPAMM